VELQINSQAVTIDAAPDLPLLWVLRDLLGMTGTKFGCGMALCGACTVLIDGQAVRSCVLPVAKQLEKPSRPLRGSAQRRWARRCKERGST
jgi:isoquinoline 1-oxidoreductase alpha subunit